MSLAAEPLDPVLLSALVASRLCHDLINPVGAIGSGLEVLEEPDMDPSMKDAALDLIRSGGRKSVAYLKYARLAYGAAGGYGAEIPTEEAGAVLKEVFGWAKADLEWRVAPASAPKEKVKTLLILAHAAADCVPRGGTVLVRETGHGYIIEAAGPRVILHEELTRAIAGETEEIKPKFAPAYIAGLMARSAGGAVTISQENEKVVIRANFS